MEVEHIRKLFSPFWVGITLLFTVIFVVLLPLSILHRYGLPKTILFTSIGVICIWVVYIIRAFIFSGFTREGKGQGKNE
ncbi:hypothetical protein ACFL6A_03145 [bacterium]